MSVMDNSPKEILDILILRNTLKILFNMTKNHKALIWWNIDLH